MGTEDQAAPSGDAESPSENSSSSEEVMALRAEVAELRKGLEDASTGYKEARSEMGQAQRERDELRKQLAERQAAEEERRRAPSPERLEQYRNDPAVLHGDVTEEQQRIREEVAETLKEMSGSVSNTLRAIHEQHQADIAEIRRSTDPVVNSPEFQEAKKILGDTATDEVVKNYLKSMGGDGTGRSRTPTAPAGTQPVPAGDGGAAEAQKATVDMYFGPTIKRIDRLTKRHKETK